MRKTGFNCLVILTPSLGKCFWWLELDCAVFLFSVLVFLGWSSSIDICSSDCSIQCYSGIVLLHSALHILLFQLFFRGQLFLLGLQQCPEHAEIPPLNFAVSLVPAFYNFLFLLLPTSKCHWKQPLVPFSIAYPYKDLPLNFVSVQEEERTWPYLSHVL